jgi:hypothetical protein
MAGRTEPEWWTRVRAKQSAVVGPTWRTDVDVAMSMPTTAHPRHHHTPTCTQSVPGTAARALSGSRAIEG